MRQREAAAGPGEDVGTGRALVPECRRWRHVGKFADFLVTEVDYELCEIEGLVVEALGDAETVHVSVLGRHEVVTGIQGAVAVRHVGDVSQLPDAKEEDAILIPRPHADPVLHLAELADRE